MILTPATAPPPLYSVHPPAASASTSGASSTQGRGMNLEPPLELPSANCAVQPQDAFFRDLKVPTVVLDTPTVPPTMAAALSLSLLGHTLFLKNQVPFPVAQLSRMPVGRSNPKVARQRDELVASLDTLASHLQTTFVALSTAYARCRLAKGRAAVATGAGAQGADEGGLTHAHLVFVLGPSANAARARIVLTIDGIQVRVWGAREEADGEEGGESEEESDMDDSEDEDASEDDSDEDDDDEQGEDDDDEATDETSDIESSDAGSGPPPSRSPSPASPLQALPSPPSHDPSPPPRSPSAPASPATAALSYAEEQRALRTAERLLSRTLMNAWVDGEGDMSSELAPTQTHVFLRAPRRFAHPAWSARQNLARALDGALAAFLEDVHAVPSAAGKSKGKPKAGRGVRTEGAWIGCQGGSAFAARRRAEEGRVREGEREVGDEDEDGEEIWWAWEGKIVGFADW
ncbi:uncharacterized protein BXZ73DRAFT_45066 [Epithele typhae]|uniref:uncharacterized protein n=1 Tax=Epithele typhae TaxID=378194 RepID=UPI0020080057|nr:uncharacterized protein BXZ73DRAFT_45066 [Epithele typhae]KAH9936853.1 hypothetical protein BXZ73DRAFT_45066 [Epithele typhae]